MSEVEQEFSYCHTCVFWDEADKYDRKRTSAMAHGKCRCRPPQIHNGHAVWPITEAGDWCGEHEGH